MDIWRVVGLAGLALLLVGCEREEKMVREDLPMAAVTKARADVQALAAAVNTYRASCGGALPDSLTELTTRATMDGAPCGPFLGSVPTAPRGWGAYTYLRQGDGFSVSTSDGTQTVSAP
ncbi:MAG TPA: hypothetical protein VLK35_13545 [Methylomirabilota bacterium]|nr:hypothetical protein [Methylomirabilota bacterium]